MPAVHNGIMRDGAAPRWPDSPCAPAIAAHALPHVLLWHQAAAPHWCQQRHGPSPGTSQLAAQRREAPGVVHPCFCSVPSQRWSSGRGGWWVLQVSVLGRPRMGAWWEQQPQQRCSRGPEAAAGERSDGGYSQAASKGPALRGLEGILHN